MSRTLGKLISHRPRRTEAVLPNKLGELNNDAYNYFVPPERLFRALDGRDLAVGGDRWHIEVYSVRDAAPDRWIQVAVRGPQEHLLTVRLQSGDGAERAILALASWLTDPSAPGLAQNVA